WLSNFSLWLPILVTATSAILAFIFGKESEKRKRHISIADEKLNLVLGQLYKEVVAISEIHKNDVSKVKFFIKNTAELKELHKIFDDVIIGDVLRLYIHFK